MVTYFVYEQNQETLTREQLMDLHVLRDNFDKYQKQKKSDRCKY